MSAYELAQKEVLEYIDPWGPKRADYQTAVIAYVMASVFGGKRKTRFKNILKMFDFADRHEQTDEDIAQLFKQIVGKK